MTSNNLISHDLLQKKFKLDHFRKGQSEIISAILSQKDVMAVLPTGGGKSLCYQYPAVLKDEIVVVISPLIALMKDQVESLKRLNIPSGYLFAQQNELEKKRIFSDIRRGGAYVLYVSPERIQKEGFKTWVQNKKIALFAVDEAHCVSQWGHDFREEYTKLSFLKSLRPDVPILALTASATPLVLDDISLQLKMKEPERMVHGFYRPNLYYQVEPCENEAQKKEYLLQALNRVTTGRRLVYCGTRKSTEDVATFLMARFKNVGYYHAGLNTQDRNRIQNQYINGEITTLVATNAFGMGINQPDVRLVVHYQVPGNIDSLYQEMGRAGRDGIDSNCLLLYSKADKGLQSFFIESSDAPAKIKTNKWNTLNALIAYAEGGGCRHGEILTYFKDSFRLSECGHCDVCAPQSDRRFVFDYEGDLTPTKGRSLKGFSSRPQKKIPRRPPTLSIEKEALFQKLKNWRKKKAAELDLPAFILFSDKILKDIAQHQPTDRASLLEVYGVGEDKAEKFGEEILAVLNK